MTTPTTEAKALRLTFGDLLVRGRGDESRRAAGRRLDVSDVTLAEVEAGRANPTVERMADLANAFGLSLRLIDDGQVAEFRRALEIRLGDATSVGEARRIEGAIAGIDALLAITTRPGSLAGPWATTTADTLARLPHQ